MTYISVPIETDEDLTAGEAFDFIASRFPGWLPSEGQLDVWIILAVARLAADLKDQASAVSTDIFRYFGPMVGVTPVDDMPATAETNWTLLDTAGHTIPFGTRVGVVDDNLDTHEFTVTADTVVPAGSNTALAVPIVATITGPAENGLGSPGANVASLDGLAWVSNITLVAATAGGADAEDDDTFLSRLANKLRQMSPSPIMAEDFAILSRDISGVYRALAIDGYNPTDNTYNNERMVTVAVTDPDGNALISTKRDEVQAYLDSMKLLNFVVHVIDPTYTTIDVQWDVTYWPGYDSSNDADINTLITNFLSPATWGTPPGGDPLQWYSRQIVKVNDIIALLGAEIAIKDVNSVTMRTGVSSYSSADIALAGAAALPRPGAISGVSH